MREALKAAAIDAIASRYVTKFYRPTRKPEVFLARWRDRIESLGGTVRNVEFTVERQLLELGSNRIVYGDSDYEPLTDDRSAA